MAVNAHDATQFRPNQCHSTSDSTHTNHHRQCFPRNRKATRGRIHNQAHCMLWISISVAGMWPQSTFETSKVSPGGWLGTNRTNNTLARRGAVLYLRQSNVRHSEHEFTALGTCTRREFHHKSSQSMSRPESGPCYVQHLRIRTSSCCVQRQRDMHSVAITVKCSFAPRVVVSACAFAPRVVCKGYPSWHTQTTTANACAFAPRVVCKGYPSWHSFRHGAFTTGVVASACAFAPRVPSETTSRPIPHHVATTHYACSAATAGSERAFVAYSVVEPVGCCVRQVELRAIACMHTYI
jgi:hypothetical protein